MPYTNTQQKSQQTSKTHMINYGVAQEVTCSILKLSGKGLLKTIAAKCFKSKEATKKQSQLLLLNIPPADSLVREVPVYFCFSL